MNPNPFLKAGMLLLSCTLAAQSPVKIKPTGSVALTVPEPSDIAYSPSTDTFFIVSDNGILFETGRDGKIMRSAIQDDSDFEAVCVAGDKVYAVDEMHRDLYEYDLKTLTVNRVINVPYAGARNKGYEAMAYDAIGNRFVLLTERDPLYLFELDVDFKVRNKTKLKIASDISAALFRDGFLWLLSDEDMTLFKVDPKSYQTIAAWKLPVINPEGFAFDKDGNLLVTCDDMQRLYYFDNPEKP